MSKTSERLSFPVIRSVEDLVVVAKQRGHWQIVLAALDALNQRGKREDCDGESGERRGSEAVPKPKTNRELA